MISISIVLALLTAVIVTAAEEGCTGENQVVSLTDYEAWGWTAKCCPNMREKYYSMGNLKGYDLKGTAPGMYCIPIPKPTKSEPTFCVIGAEPGCTGENQIRSDQAIWDGTEKCCSGLTQVSRKNLRQERYYKCVRKSGCRYADTPIPEKPEECFIGQEEGCTGEYQQVSFSDYKAWGNSARCCSNLSEKYIRYGLYDGTTLHPEGIYCINKRGCRKLPTTTTLKPVYKGAGGCTPEDQVREKSEIEAGTAECCSGLKEKSLISFRTGKMTRIIKCISSGVSALRAVNEELKKALRAAKN